MTIKTVGFIGIGNMGTRMVPHIAKTGIPVHIYDLKKTADGHLYIIMEYIDGYDVERIIRALRKAGQKMPPYLAAYIIAEICVALDYANQRLDSLTNKPLNLVHQDVSPSNIMVSRHGGVKLIDFGISSVKLHQKTEKKSWGFVYWKSS